MDFVHDAYRELIETFLRAEYRVVTVRQAATEDIEPPVLILRHDVEWSADRALALAAIERDLGVRSTLYFRVDTKANDITAMAKLQSDGFDIGYHYNCLDRTGGNFEAAVELFERDIEDLRGAGIDVASAVAHGNPRLRRVGYRRNADLVQWDPDLLPRMGLFDLGPWGRTIDRIPRLFNISDANLQWNHGEISRAFFPRAVRYQGVPSILMLVHTDYWSKSWPRAATMRAAAFGLRHLRVNAVIALGRRMVGRKAPSSRGDEAPVASGSRLREPDSDPTG